MVDESAADATQLLDPTSIVGFHFARNQAILLHKERWTHYLISIRCTRVRGQSQFPAALTHVVYEPKRFRWRRRSASSTSNCFRSKTRVAAFFTSASSDMAAAFRG